MVYFRHRNEEEKRPERMIEKREKEKRKREKEVEKIYFIVQIYYFNEQNRKIKIWMLGML